MAAYPQHPQPPAGGWHKAGAGHKAPRRRGQENGFDGGMGPVPAPPGVQQPQPPPPPGPADAPFRRHAPAPPRGGKQVGGMLAQAEGPRVNAATARHQERMLARQNKRAMQRDREQRQRALARKIFEREKEQKQRREEELAREQREEMARIMYERMCAGLRAEEAKRYRAAARKIQRVYRGYLARDMIARCESACVTIQALVRSHQSRVRQRRKREQELIDRAQAVQQGRRNRAAIRIQRRARYWFARRQIQRIKRSKALRRWYCARKIQNCWRRYRKALEKEMMIREVELRQSEEERQQHLHQSACLIQAVWRGFKTRIRVRRLREENEAKHAAATVIQRRVRGMLARRRVREMKHTRARRLFTSEQRGIAAMRIQRFVRVALAKAELQRRRMAHAVQRRSSRLHKASATIQRTYRCYRARIVTRKIRKLRVLQERQAVVVQGAWRGYTARQEVARRREERKKEPAARTIQGEWRASIDRQEQRKAGELSGQRRQAEEEAEQRTRAAISVQAWTRGEAGRREAHRRRQAVLQRHAAAETIQRCVRVRLAKKEANQMRVLRSHVLKAEERDRQRERAAIHIQREVRTWSAKRSINLRRRREGAALKIQCRFREHKARQELSARRQHRDHLRRTAAAVRIQRMVRNALQRIELNRLAEYYNGVQQRKLLKQRREEAALCVQSLWRGHRARQAVLEVRRENMRLFRAAVVMQRCFRTWKRRMRTSAIVRERAEERRRKLSAAVRIQNFWRMVLAQEFVQMLREDREVRSDAATAVQCWWRRKAAAEEAARRRGRRRQQHDDAAKVAMRTENGVLAVQAACRAKLSGLLRLRKQAAHIKQHLSEARSYADSVRQGAAIRIQAQWRAHSDRQYVRGLRQERRERRLREQEERRRRNAAATKIQSAQRQRVARSEMERRKQRREELAIARRKEYDAAEEPADVVQQLFWELEARSGRLLQLERKQQLQRRQTAACIIQRTARRSAARGEASERRRNRRLDKAATVIQRAWDIKRARLRATREVRRQLAAILLQAWARGVAARRRASQLRQAEQEHIRQTLGDEEVVDAAVVTLQSFWRSVSAQRQAAEIHQRRASRRDAHGKREAALFIQRAYRGMLGRKRYRAARLARERADQEEEHRRMYPANTETRGRKHSVKERDEAAAKIQSLQRRKAAEAELQRKRNEAEARKLAMKQEQAAETIQKAWRGDAL
eukprot:TRINITY_DN3604_c0_g2_i1.p1 TRINITY_DN3604_c0_g2~~TRINITY_DN3604_c0_g2_i1.p1  ORF type:complete len:1205 (+),score=471.82 TRINITY_DN3604_c0_g2_i1:52-3666(+)